MAETRSKNEILMTKLYGLIGLDSTESDYLLSMKRLKSPATIINAHENERIFTYVDAKFSEGAALLLDRLAQYLLWYRQDHGDFSKLQDVFTNEAFEAFDPKKVSSSSQGSSTTAPLGETASDSQSLKVRVTDFPTFDGKHVNWTRFYEKFTAVCELHKMDDLLNEDPDHETKMENDPTYRERCNELYSILKACCSTGIALPKINAYKPKKNGYLAWRSLIENYFATGDIQDYAAGCLSILHNF